jgi:hypothetical protein
MRRYSTVLLTAHEIQCGIGEDYWEVYDESFDIPSIIYVDDFADFLDNVRKEGYDVHINTYASWEAMDEYL